MTTTPRSSRTNRRQALVMIAYTFVLSLGAAVPFAVSFSQDARPAVQGRVRCGGYQRAEPSETEGRPVAGDQPQAPVAPRVVEPVGSTSAACAPVVPSAALSVPATRRSPPRNRV